MNFLDKPILFAAAATLRNAQLGRHIWVTPKSDLVIEGYPRSANTYLHRIVRAAGPKGLRIANHVHRPQQISMAVRYGIPCFILFRHPLDCIASYLVREPDLEVADSLKQYIGFAQTTLAHNSAPQIHIVTFDGVIEDAANISSAILQKIGHDVTVTTELIEKATLDKRKEKSRSSLPNAEKDRLKQKYYDQILASPRYLEALELFEQAVALKWPC
ncbi:hypothetical protein [Ruegeria atlantica]|uniref:hypothetical protein n=1 Tax=Ruegeria atlantica TaxID=81569 RepID=UPI00147C8123|nr:hypothetical protein [Ruegeria atlantica]